MADQDGAAYDEQIRVHLAAEALLNATSPPSIGLAESAGTPNSSLQQRQSAAIDENRLSTDSSSATNAMTHHLPDITTRLGEVVQAIDEVNRNLGAFRGTFTDVRTGIGRVLDRQEREHIRVRERHDEGRRQATLEKDARQRYLSDKLREMTRLNDEKLNAQNLKNVYLVTEQRTNMRQAADIQRAVDIFEALFGELGIVAQWVSRWVRKAAAWGYGEVCTIQLWRAN
jgi:hypothetical protein